MEYETLAKKIKDYPSRNNSEEYFFFYLYYRNVNILTKEIEELTNKKNNISLKLERRRNQFLLLMRTIYDLKNDLSTDVFFYFIIGKSNRK